ncbi:MAG TPA: choice-of-anchor D domain-containing protein, partial [Candidatus Kapabacteria bacterium]|nr:choice-of-anchor D domain-containing protein [Candidatus Kapabacteria bacterium]
MKSLPIRALALALIALCLTASTSARADRSFVVQPSEKLLFEAVLGTVTTQTITIQNVVDRTITLDVMHQANEAFTINVPTQVTLKAKEAVSFEVVFNPTIAEFAEGWIMVSEANSAGARIYLKGITKGGPSGALSSPEYFTLGPAPVGKADCKQVEAYNQGKTPVLIQYALAGYSKAFNLPTDNEHTFTLDAGAKGTVAVCFQPIEGMGDQKEELIFKYSYDGGVTFEKTSTWLFGILEREIDPNMPCLMTNERVGLGPVMAGQSVDGMIYLLNTTGSPITITSATISGESAVDFAITEVLPLTVAANSKGMIGVRFSPSRADQTQYNAEVEFALLSETDKCTSARTLLAGWTTEKHREDMRIPIFADGRKTIGIEWTANSLAQKVQFFNNLDHAVEVK